MHPSIEQFRKGVETHSPAETGDWAQKLAPCLPSDSTLCLKGPVGAGKTCFAAALAKAMGAESQVTSPTYNLLCIHHAKDRTILHLDAYRLNEETDYATLDLDDLMQSPWLLLVEWPENIPSLLPKESWWLTFAIRSESQRFLQLDPLPEDFST
ncbi:MAG: tRNA (adenosine(37)-N6)-threonylcarbamoyltransferase complex ATPase subunit type 1 TsaE [Opitutae bacterium]|nr:tRNA (adenosine(37)-N6)-threonylcarbamoyltransferase complex ATPase subunit type 1 TsaE [Opitutae bacterium]|tara:strand:+ start:13396 stop:13857 length:462 start_codon:yes stop_codon:yes gene_type:complete